MEHFGERPGIRDASAQLTRFGPSRFAMTARYIAALALIGFLVLGEHISVDRLMRAQEKRAGLIERNARQRLLVQRLAEVSQQLLAARDSDARDHLRGELIGAAEGLRSIEGAVADANGEPLPLEEQIYRYLDAAESLATAPDSLLLANQDHYRRIMIAEAGETSERLESSVARLVAQAEAQVRQIRRVALAMLIATLVSLILIAAFIFEPMVRRILRKRRLLQHAAGTLARISSQDGLTGIANRRAFDRRIEEEWRRAERDGKVLGLLMIDIDHFKEYNDHYGHQKGDECLIKIARMIQEGISRPGDFVARYGGEEFVVLLPNTPAAGAMRVAEELRQRIEAQGIPHEAPSATGVVTISIGAAVVDPRQDDCSPNGLIRAADLALYEAKDMGRNRVEMSWSRESLPRDPGFGRLRPGVRV